MKKEGRNKKRNEYKLYFGLVVINKVNVKSKKERKRDKKES